jgi:type IV pilus assembly protein PilX
MKHISRSITGLMLRRKSQQGAALLISLILLLVLTFLGITSMQTTTLEERMTANQKDYYLAFEAAEYALDFAETELAVLFSTGNFDVDGPNGLYQGHLTDSEHVWKTVNWSDETKVKVLDDYLDFGITSEAPKFIVEVMQIVESGLDTHNIGNEYGEQTGATKTTIFRVTARGASGKGSVVFLQSTFGKAI